MERVARIELASSVWKTAASPFGQTRIEFGRRSWTRTKEVAWTTVLRTAAIATLPSAEIVGTSLTNRTPFIAVRSRNAGSTGRGVMLCGALPTESNLVFSRLQGERRRIWLEGRIRHTPALMRKRLTNVSLATGDRHARTHTCHRWPVCYCYPVVKELRTRRRCAGRKNKKARMLARSGPWATQRRRRLRASTSARIERVRIKIHWLLMLGRIPAHFPKGRRTQARRGQLP